MSREKIEISGKELKDSPATILDGDLFLSDLEEYIRNHRNHDVCNMKVRVLVRYDVQRPHDHNENGET